MNDEFDFNKIVFERMDEVTMWEKFPYWKNVHGFNKSQYFDNLYRIESFDCFKENVTKNRFFFRHPDGWLKDNDNRDSILLRQQIVLSDGTKAGHGYYERTFCQCWSCSDSKRMWEEYAKDYGKGYVKMVSKLDRLMRAFDNTVIFKGYSSSFWAGRVNYSNLDIDNLLIRLKSEEEERAFFDLELISQLYLAKGSSFDFEDEVRFINFFEKDLSGQAYAFVGLKKPLNQILDGIIIDSRLINESLRSEIMSFADKQGIKVLENKISWD